MYWVYYKPKNIPVGNTGDYVIECVSIEEAFSEYFRLKKEGNRNVKVLKEVIINF